MKDTVGVIGLGYVGLPLALLFEEGGCRVLGFDLDAEKVASLAAGHSYIRHIGSSRIAGPVGRGTFLPTSDFDRLAECDAILICVPTPLGRHREPDLSFVRSTADEIARRLRPGQLIVLESTTYPGTTREELLPRFEARGLRCGSRTSSSRFRRSGKIPAIRNFRPGSIPKVVGGIDEPSLNAAVRLYSAVMETVVPVSSPEVAEASKLLENIFRSVNIALVNELKTVFARMGIDVWEVIEAAKTKPFGFMAFYPGPGLGGHCIPLDPFYMAWKAAETGTWARFIELAGEINSSMPRYVAQRTAEAINAQGKSVKGARILVLGLSYKPEIDDDRESPSFEILELFREMGAEIAYCDPHIPAARKGRRHRLDLKSVPCSAEEFGKYDALVISTAHSQFLDPELYRKASLVVDTRNALHLDFTPPVVVKA